MTDEPAAIRAAFADFRLIKGRKQAQLVLEIPIEEADNALAVLGGIPQPQSDHWVAVARLNGIEKPEPEPKEKRRWEDLKLSMQASIRCNEPAFWKFCQEKARGFSEMRSEMQAADIASSLAAAEWVRRYCGIESRSALNTSNEAARKWLDLENQYQAWLKVA